MTPSGPVVPSYCSGTYTSSSRRAPALLPAGAGGVAGLAAGGVRGVVRETGDDVAGERGAQLARARRRADELRGFRVVEDRPVAVVHLELDRVERRQRTGLRAGLVGGVVEHLLDCLEAAPLEPVDQVGLAEVRLEPEAH